MRCPHCGQKLVQQQDGVTQVRIKGRLLIKDDGAHTQCFWCGADVVVPIQLAEPKQQQGPKLILRKAAKAVAAVGGEGAAG